MTIKEALSLLSINETDLDNIEDIYEDQVFAAIQFFSGQPILSKTFRTRLKKELLKSEAFSMLGVPKGELTSVEVCFELESKTIISLVRSYYELRNTVQLELRSANSFERMAIAVNKLIVLQASYMKEWPKIDLFSEGVLVGVEPDPVEFWRAVTALPNGGDVHFNSISQEGLKENEVFFKEWKRISLLAQKEKEWMKS